MPETKVFMVAVLYRWTCPECHSANTLNTIPVHRTAFCPACNACFEVAGARHKLGDVVLEGTDFDELGPAKAGVNGKTKLNRDQLRLFHK